MLQLKKRDSAKGSVAENEFPESHFIPYDSHFDSETILTKNNELLQVIQVDGFSFETADDEDLDMKKNVRNSLLKSLANGNYAMWFHTIRRRKAAYPEGRMPHGFPDLLDRQWKSKHEAQESFKNDLYITVIRKENTRGIAAINHWIKKISSKAEKGAQERNLREAHKELIEVTDRVLATLRDYGARRLGTVNTEAGAMSEVLEFLGRVVNCGFQRPIRVPTQGIDRVLPSVRLFFGSRAIEIRGPAKTRYAAMVSVKEYGPQTAAGMLDAFLRLPFEFIISQSFLFVNRQTSIEEMKRQQARMQQAQDVAVSQIAEIYDALDAAMSGHIAFGTHHLSVMCIEDDVKALEGAVSQTVAELVNIGVNAVREKLNLEPVYWGQLPANYKFVARKATISTLNLASLASMHNYPVGRIKGNHWGDAVTVLDTDSGTPYFFNFHLRDVGHTTIIGPTGSGKTVLMNFLCAQAQKYKCRLFFFDKDRGADIFIRAIRGTYNIVDISEPSGFNPLQLPDTAENRAFLVEWIKSLVTVNNEIFTAEDMDRVSEAINGNYKLSREDRVLRNIVPFLGLEGPGTLAGRLRMWHTGGSYAKLFDNLEDNVDFDGANIFGFEMGEIIRNKVTLVPVLLYLFHRISLSLDGTPTMIVLDEAWALIENSLFATKIKDWLKTLRKLNAMVIFATQSVEDASKSNISDTLLQQTSTQIFLPNPKATEEYKKAFMLTHREFVLIKTTDPGSRFFLLKQGNDVVVARIDLSGMRGVVPVLSGRADTVQICDEVRREYGNNPDVWLPAFIDRVENDA